MNAFPIMNQTTMALLISFASILGWSHPDNIPSQFSSTSDRLVVNTEQIKGLGLLYYLASRNNLNFKDFAEYEVLVPADLGNLKYATVTVDIQVAGYQRTLASGDKDNKHYKKLILESKINPANLPSYKDNSICIIEGTKGKDTVFIIDQNNNKDFRDDPIRSWNKIDPFSTRDLIKVDYLIYNGQEYVTASNWINIGLFDGDKCYFASQHYLASFHIDGSSYKVEIFVDDNRFNFHNPKIALVSDNGRIKETVPENEIINIGEVLKLKEGYYRFSDLSNDGSRLILMKEDGFHSLTGTQVGMMAPDFMGKSFNGETVHLKQLLDKPLLLANISGCAPDSYDVYQNMLKKCAGKINVLGIESGIHKDLGGILIDVENPFNKDLYNKYRKAYSNYNCFLIGLDRKIIDKFTLFNWQSRLDPFLDSLKAK